MPERTDQKSIKTIEFSNFGRRVVEGRFDGGSMTSDGGVMLLNETDRKLGLTRADEGKSVPIARVSDKVVSRNKSSVVEGRLRTNEVTVDFFLGCDECSATVQVVSCDGIVAHLNSQMAIAQPSLRNPRETGLAPNGLCCILEVWCHTN